MFTSLRSVLANVESDDVVSRDGTWYGGKSDRGIEGYAMTIEDSGFPLSSLLVRSGKNCCTVSMDEIRRVLIVSTSSLGGIARNGPTG